MFRGRIGPGGSAGLQNRDGGAIRDSGGFDSHTLPPARRRASTRQIAALVALGLLLASSLVAQEDTTAVSPSLVVIQAGPPDSGVAVQDTLRFPRAPVSPFGAFFRSLVLPGWSQAMLGRRLTAGLFMAWEGVSLGMYLKAARELRYLESVEDPGVEGKRQERQDWLILLAFNHLFAGLEGFVSSHLWDFPDDVRLRALPDGRGVGVAIPFRVP